MAGRRARAQVAGAGQPVRFRHGLSAGPNQRPIHQHRRRAQPAAHGVCPQPAGSGRPVGTGPSLPFLGAVDRCAVRKRDVPADGRRRPVRDQGLSKRIAVTPPQSSGARRRRQLASPVIQKISAALLAVLLVAAVVAWWQTAPPSPKVVARRAATVTSSALVDESAYTTAQRVAQLATTPQEQPFVATALRVADHELALAFTAALRDAEAHPPTLSPEALNIQDRLQKSQVLLDADQQRVAQPTSDLAQAKPSQKDTLQDELDLAKSQLDLDKDELEEADQDLVAAGGNPQERIEAMVQEHDAQVKARASGAAASAGAAAPMAGLHGAWTEFRDWLKTRQKLQPLAGAEEAARVKAAALSQQRAALAASLESAKGGISELSQHTKSAKAAAAAAAGPHGPHTHEDAAALLGRTKLITADQKVLTLLDRQTADLRQLAGVYQQWIGVVALQSNGVLHKLLLDAAVVMGILLVLLFVDKWAQHLLNNPKLDRRQVETLRSITRVSLRVIAAVIILLILIGVPS